MKKFFLLPLIVLLFLTSSLYGDESGKFMVIVSKAPCYSSPSSSSQQQGSLTFGSVVFAKKVKRHDDDFDFLQISYPGFSRRIYVPLEMTMPAPVLRVSKSDNSFSLQGGSEIPFPYVFVPEDLVKIDSYYTIDENAVYGSREVISDLYAMLKEARSKGHHLAVARGYDDLGSRIKLYEEAISKDPKQTSVPKPLNSRYGSGRIFDIVDIKSGRTYQNYADNPEAVEWLNSHGREYGFALHNNHYALLYTGTKEKFVEETIVSFPERIDQKVNFGSICSVHILKKSDFQYASYIWVHHNEKSGEKTLHYALDTYGGHSVYIINDDKRNLYIKYGRGYYSVDPNRIFTDTGISMSLSKNNKRISSRIKRRLTPQIQKIRNEILSNLDWNSNKYVIALHSNRSDSEFSINEYNKKNAYLTYTNPSHNPKNLFYTTSLDDYYFIKSKKYNVVYQRTAEDDGSLSVYAAKKNLPYINIEVEEGEDRMQKEMFDIAIECIRHNYRIKGF